VSLGGVEVVDTIDERWVEDVLEMVDREEKKSKQTGKD